MSAGKPFTKCSRCDDLLKDFVCRKCRLVHCPFCGRSEKEDQCPHLLADWAGIGGHSDHFNHSPFLEGTPPFLDVEFDSPMILLPIDFKTAIGDLSPLLDAYGEDLFQPPGNCSLFEAMTKMISTPCFRASRPEGGMAAMGGHVFWFASDTTTAKAEITSLLFELRDRLKELKQQLHARMMDEQRRDPRSQSKPEEVVYGKVGGSLVFSKKSDALKLVRYRNALKTSKTWGEFRSQLDPEEYSYVLEYYEPTDFSGFYDEFLKNNPGATPEQAREKYLALPIGERIPEDDDPFEEGLDSDWVVEGYWPSWPSRMVNWVPEEILDLHGAIESSYVSDEGLTFCPESERIITATFRKLGYQCIRDEKLIEQASGYDV
jgi:hypothetical protein